MEDGEFALGRGSWIDGDASTETVFEVLSGYREGDAFMATHFAETFDECASDTYREVVIEDYSDKPFTGWNLAPIESRWYSLPSDFCQGADFWYPRNSNKSDRIYYHLLPKNWVVFG